MRHQIMTIELRCSCPASPPIEALTSIPLTPEEKEARDLAELTQIIFPLSELHHVTHHLSSMALGLMVSPCYSLNLQIGQHYGGTISDKIALQLLQPGYVMLDRLQVHITAVPHLEDTIGKLAWPRVHVVPTVAAVSDNAVRQRAKPRHYQALTEWLARNEILVKEAQSLWQRQLWDEASDVAAYTQMVLGATQLTYLQNSLDIPGLPRPDLFGYLHNGVGEPLWPFRKKAEALWSVCTTILDDHQKMEDEKEAEEEKRKAEADRVEAQDGEVLTLRKQFDAMTLEDQDEDEEL